MKKAAFLMPASLQAAMTCQLDQSLKGLFFLHVSKLTVYNWGPKRKFSLVCLEICCDLL